MSQQRYSSNHHHHTSGENSGQQQHNHHHYHHYHHHDNGRSYSPSVYDDIDRYLEENNIESLFTSVAEALCLYRPHNPELFIVDYIQNKFVSPAHRSTARKIVRRAVCNGRCAAAKRSSSSSSTIVINNNNNNNKKQRYGNHQHHHQQQRQQQQYNNHQRPSSSSRHHRMYDGDDHIVGDEEVEDDEEEVEVGDDTDHADQHRIAEEQADREMARQRERLFRSNFTFGSPSGTGEEQDEDDDNDDEEEDDDQADAAKTTTSAAAATAEGDHRRQQKKVVSASTSSRKKTPNTSSSSSRSRGLLAPPQQHQQQPPSTSSSSTTTQQQQNRRRRRHSHEYHPFGRRDSRYSRDSSTVEDEEGNDEGTSYGEIDFNESENRRRRYSVSVPVRRGGVSAEILDVKDIDNYKRVVIKKSPEERERLREALASVALFNTLEDEDLQVIFDAMFERKCKAGDCIMKQGDAGDNFYVVDSGECDIFVQGPSQTDTPHKVLTVGPGGTFGELALMFGVPRAATIVAQTDCRLWALDRMTYRRIIMQQSLKKRNLYENFLSRVQILQTLTPYERLTVADALQPQTYGPGETIVRQGDHGDKFYIIVEGEARVTKTVDGGQEVELTSLKQSDYFGELALLYDQPRAATVVAVGQVKVVCLDRRSFKKLLGPCEELLKRNTQLYSQYVSRAV